MPHYCCVPRCTHSGSGHAFPKDPELRLKWRIALNREDPKRKGVLWSPTPYSVICPRHFKPEDYKETLLGLRKRLKPDAVPSVFNFNAVSTPLKEPLVKEVPGSQHCNIPGFQFTENDVQKATVIIPQKNITFKPAGHSEWLMEEMYNLWVQERLCDVIIQTHDGECKAHSLVLAVQSPILLQSLELRVEDRGHRSSVLDISWSEVSYASMQQILHFAYTGSMTLKETDIPNIIQTAEKFKMDKILGACSEYITRETVAMDSPESGRSLPGMSQDGLVLNGQQTLKRPTEAMDMETVAKRRCLGDNEPIESVLMTCTEDGTAIKEEPADQGYEDAAGVCSDSIRLEVTGIQSKSEKISDEEVARGQSAPVLDKSVKNVYSPPSHVNMKGQVMVSILSPIHRVPQPANPIFVKCTGSNSENQNLQLAVGKTNKVDVQNSNNSGATDGAHAPRLDGKVGSSRNVQASQQVSFRPILPKLAVRNEPPGPQGSVTGLQPTPVLLTCVSAVNSPSQLTGYYSCTICKALFNEEEPCKDHMDMMHGEIYRKCYEYIQPYHCKACNIVFQLKAGAYNQFESHMEQNHQIKMFYRCTICGMSRSGMSFIIGHLNNVHKIPISLVAKYTSNHTKPVSDACPNPETDCRNPFEFLSQRTVRPFCCSVCWADFTDEADCVAHLKEHDIHKKSAVTYVRSMSCRFCGQVANVTTHTLHHLLEHIQEKHRNNATLSCGICRANFTNDTRLLQHLYSAHASLKHEDKKQVVKYIEIGKTEDTLANVPKHINRMGHEHIDPYCCKICWKSFAVKADCAKHVSESHDLWGDETANDKVMMILQVTCELCGMTGNLLPRFCDVLASHALKEHNVNMTFHCKICTSGPHKKCNRLIDHLLKCHSIVENVSVQYMSCRRRVIEECEVCGWRVADSPQQMRDHKLYHHQIAPPGKDKADILTCPYCTWQGLSKHKQQRHIKTHTEEKKIMCELCGKLFLRKAQLDAHLRTAHSDEKPFSCKLCPYRCKRSVNLDVHMRSHTKECPWHCDKCSYTSSSSCNLRAHLARRHNITMPLGMVGILKYKKTDSGSKGIDKRFRIGTSKIKSESDADVDTDTPEPDVDVDTDTPEPVETDADAPETVEAEAEDEAEAEAEVEAEAEAEAHTDTDAPETVETGFDKASVSVTQLVQAAGGSAEMDTSDNDDETSTIEATFSLSLAEAETSQVPS